MYWIYLCYFATEGMLYPFWQTWLKSLGYANGDIALFVSAAYWPQVLMGFALTYLADWRFSQLRLAGASALLAALCVTLYYTPRHTPFYLLLSLLYGGFWASVLPLGEAYLLAQEQVASHDYGRVRSMGSLAFIVLSIGGGGLLSLFGQSLVPGVVACLMASTGVACFYASGDFRHGRLRLNTAPLLARARPDWRLLKEQPSLLLALSSAGLIQLSHCLYFFTASNKWSSQGYSPTWIGLFWAVAVIAEILYFRVSGSIVRRFPPLMVMMWSGGIAAVRWILFGIDGGLALIVLVQLLHAFSFAAYHAALMRHIRDHAPASLRNSVQGLYYSLLVALPMGIATPVAGRLFDVLPAYAYALMVLFAAAGAAVAWQARARYDNGFL